MLGSIRKFSTSIYAKILLGIVIIPFVFWGMGSSLTSGNKNIVVVIDKEKYSIQHFTDFISINANEKVKRNQIDNYLSEFIGEKLIEKEIENLGIVLSDKSLSKLIKNQQNFKKENEFSRTEYEKFLLQNNITAVNFESILTKQEKKKQLLDYIGGGVLPPKFLVNIAYDRINQKRNIKFINLNDVFKKKLNFSNTEIKNYYEKNKDSFNEIYKSFKIIELNPKNLVGVEDYNDLFFKRIDEIDDLIIGGQNLEYLIEKFNFDDPKLISINELGQSINSENINISKKNLSNTFLISLDEPTVLLEDDNKYYISQIYEEKVIEKNYENESTKKEIIDKLALNKKREFTSEIIAKINKNEFTKNSFDKFSNDENANVKNVVLKNINDTSTFNEDILSEIYKYPEKKVIIVNEIGFLENYLIYIDKIENVKINKNTEDYMKYEGLSKIKIIGDLYNTYDNYLNKIYKIDINYQAVDTVKNYFN